jgi:hypothetical protein
VTDFPTGRFIAAGATPEEAAFLAESFDARPETEQRAALDFYASIADGDIRERVESMREAGHLDRPEPDMTAPPVIAVSTAHIGPATPTEATDDPEAVSGPPAPPVAPSSVPEAPASNVGPAPSPEPASAPPPDPEPPATS